MWNPHATHGAHLRPESFSKASIYFCRVRVQRSAKAHSWIGFLGSGTAGPSAACGCRGGEDGSFGRRSLEKSLCGERARIVPPISVGRVGIEEEIYSIRSVESVLIDHCSSPPHVRLGNGELYVQNSDSWNEDAGFHFPSTSTSTSIWKAQ
jgi:hypothetical protein